MTVNSTLITAYYTAHATDSFLTELQPDGSRKIVEDQRTKIIRIPAFRGAMTYYGLAQCSGWSTLDWLRSQSSNASNFSCPEHFALNLVTELTSKISKIRFQRDLDRLLGIHFTTYERVSDYWVPEFFHIRNWIDPPYSTLNPAGFEVSRVTYATLMKLPDCDESHRDARFRLAVHEALHSGVFFRFNNGDPWLFNPVANALMDAVSHLKDRKHLIETSDVKFHLSLVRRPVEVVSKLLAEIALPTSCHIGGKPHDLAISSNGITQSTTGD